MIDVGMVGLDTSHASAFAPLLDERDDMRLYSVWDSLKVRDSAYVDSFCDEHDAKRYDGVEAMVDDIDAAMVLTVNWETHRPLAEQFLEVGIPTLVDKPLTGSLDELRALERAADNAPLFGGSAVPFHRKIDSLPRGGSRRTIYAAGYNDYFYYRAHVIDIVRTLADADWREVQLGNEPGTTVDIWFENGTHATLRLDGDEEEGAFSVLDVGETTNIVQIESGRNSLDAMYRPFLSAFNDSVRRERDDTDRVLNSGELLLGVEAAIEQNQPVTPRSNAVNAVNSNGDAFVSDYQPYY